MKVPAPLRRRRVSWSTFGEPVTLRGRAGLLPSPGDLEIDLAPNERRATFER